MTLETDYLIIGAGACGLAFADEMLTRTNAHMTIVDKRHAVGGHWNDTYPFVKLHQPSVFYGVGSTDLGDGRIDKDGVNAGFMSLASGTEVTQYFHTIMRDRLLPSGRVRYFPVSEVTPDHQIRHLLSEENTAITVRKKVVDAAYNTNSVPRTHQRKFDVADTISCHPVNDLPRLAPDYKSFVILGAGKTAMDAVVWLMTHNVNPDAVSWVIPRDPWMWNRATTQPGDAYFNNVFSSFADRQEALSDATSISDFAYRMEKADIWMRLDPDIEPTLYHAATVSKAELALMRRVKNIIRLGRVKSITTQTMHLEKGDVPVPSLVYKGDQPLFVDCTACGLTAPPVVPVFNEDRITIQMVRFPQFPFSAALIAYLEATMEDDAQKNSFCAPLPLGDDVEAFVRLLIPDFMNRMSAARHPDVRAWINESRLDGYSGIAANINETDTEKLAILKRIKAASYPAAENIQKILQKAG